MFKTHQKSILWLMIVGYILVFSGFCLGKYYNFGYNALDLAIINQVFYNSSQGNFFASSIHPPTYLGDHFTPILFLLIPFYCFFKHPLTLLILQTIILGLSAWPIYLIAKQTINKNWGIIIALAWLLNPLVQNINLFEFSFLPLAIFLILWAIYFYQNQKYYPFIILSLLALLVREDVALVIFMFSILAILDKRKIKWWLPPIIFSTIYFLLALKITDLFSKSGQYKFFIYYSWLGNSGQEFIINFIFEPWRVIAHLINLGNLEFILGLLLPFAFLPLLKPKYLILGLGIFAQLVLGAAGGSATLLQLHYSALILPALFLATIYALAKILSSPDKTKSKIINLINWEKPLSFLIFLIAIIYSSLALGPVIGGITQFYQNGLTWPQTSLKNEFIKKIPPQASVAATYEFLTKLSSREKIYSFNYVFLGKQQFLNQDYALPEDTQYLLIDFQDLLTYQLQYGQNDFYQERYQVASQNFPQVLTNFGLVEINDTLALYQRGQKDKFNLLEIFSTKPVINQAQNLSLDNKIKFLGYNQPTNNYFQFFWQAEKEMTKNYQLQLILTKDSNVVAQKIYPFAYGIFPTSLWQIPEVVQTNYWFNFDKKIPGGSYNLKIKLIEIQKGGVEVDPIRSTTDVIDKQKALGQEIEIGPIIL